MKVCVTCKKELDSSFFPVGRNECRECLNKKSREYYQEHREKLLNASKEYFKKNKESILIKKHEYLAKNREKINQRLRNHYHENIDWYKEYNVKNREGRRSKKLFKKYGISQQEYEILLKKQDYRCKICGTETPGGNHNIFYVDHNHITGTIRGLLCTKYNSGIGFFDDNLNLIKEAGKYLEQEHHDEWIVNIDKELDNAKNIS